MRYRFGGLIFGGAYTWRGLFSEFYGIIQNVSVNAVMAQTFPPGVINRNTGASRSEIQVFDPKA